MAFLGKGLKVDLQVMATEMGVEDVLGLKVEERKRKEGMELEERKRRDEMDFELQKKRIELKEEHENEVKGPGQIKIDLHKLIPKFDSRNMILVYS
ncbi:hypothetical protein TNIN_120671 [Trichonephila inaurata madagascariensis]|uniref:Uncharacterized protein n=1 Tax=Trichonephila inaurata madagascariensis TaxID=2747483 RepID=A0A8X6X4E6_9ARAC|nr:hypothetical protein TNIN_120671 [Trichonephila inaurata madagascariensis]